MCSHFSSDLRESEDLVQGGTPLIDCETLSILYSGSVRTISILEAERECGGDAWNVAD